MLKRLGPPELGLSAGRCATAEPLILVEALKRAKVDAVAELLSLDFDNAFHLEP